MSSMDERLREVKSKSHWLETAVVRIHEIRVRWQLTSDSSFSKRLHVHARTIANLNRFHPDPSLRFETVLGIFRTLLLLAPTQNWSTSRMEKEKLLIQADMMAVINARIPIPQGVMKDLADAADMEQYLDTK